ncbi:acetoacetate--CoA ligase [Sphingobacterium shayense]|uniref:acetoacetate--CoA ligase n=1 Tax=Sphingobacterium shayense TaxID=626343 RepID=UPI001551BBEC|nr:acetoacetate--CoA ligase [Sphingobacterium shayense]NQD70519.1 acetoacetate--CoA ligase [Sphingobacterium shayense]
MKKPLWTPTKAYIEHSPLYEYQQYIADRHDVKITDYAQMHQWSIDNLAIFWESILHFFNVKYSGQYNTVFTHRDDGSDFTDINWFEGISLSYCENIFLGKNPNAIAVKYADENTSYLEFTWEELKTKVSCLQQYLKDNGILEGDRVVGLLNNTVETLVIFLAVNSIGAIWSCCSPDFGDTSIVERFNLIQPKMLFAETSYQYSGKQFDKSSTVLTILSEIDSIEKSVVINSREWDGIFVDYSSTELLFHQVRFDHPLWILYSSGTTGKPKAITHRTGGNLIEHLKALALHQNVQEGDNFLWYTTTGWMMWNYALSSLLCGATLCLYNGAINYKSHQTFWNFIKQSKVDHLGAGAAYFSSIHDLTITGYIPKVIGSTGSPLPEATFENLQQKFPEAHIISLSGGTDVCSAFLSGCSLIPVYPGEIQCRTLGSDIVAYDDHQKEVVDGLGELVIRQPMPAMPLYFWGDNENKKYKESYFSSYLGIWSHGDWIEINKRGGIIMHGRSDSTLNRGGVRIGTAEIYNALLTVVGIADSLVIVKDRSAGDSEMILFIQLDGKSNFDEVVEKAKYTLRTEYSPRHVPDLFYQIHDIPYTLSGKKLEIPIKKIFAGLPPDKAVIRDIMRNPASLDEYVNIYNKLN